MGLNYEKQTCGRCDGSGRFKFNRMDGSRCYGCGGTGTTLTKRGRAAKAYADSLLMMPIEVYAAQHAGRVAKYDDLFECKRITFDGVAERKGDPASQSFSLVRKGSEIGCTLGPGCTVRLVATASELERIAAYQSQLRL